MSAVSSNNRNEAGFIPIIIAVVIIVIVIAVLISANKQKASYQASSTGIAVVSPTTVSVSFRVKNVGKVSGTPDCTISVSSPDDSSTGVTAGKLSNSIAPGATTNSADTVTVTHNAASTITAAKVTCV